MTKLLPLEILRTACDHARDGIVITDIGTPLNAIVWANETFRRMTGYDKDALIGKGTRFLMGSRTRPSAAALFRKALGTGSRALVTVSTVKADGTEFWNEISMSPIPDDAGKVRYFIGICRDVSPRIAAQEALIAAEMSLETVDTTLDTPTYDPVTRLYNRHYVEEYAEREWLLLQRQKRPLTVFLMELEGLDRYEQDQGAGPVNTLLEQMADALRSVFRRGMDLVARFDAYHFLACASGTGWEEAEPMARQALDSLQSVSAGHEGVAARVVAVTAIPEEHLSVDELILRAQTELEKARVNKELLRVAALD